MARREPDRARSAQRRNGSWRAEYGFWRVAHGDVASARRVPIALNRIGLQPRCARRSTPCMRTSLGCVAITLSACTSSPPPSSHTTCAADSALGNVTPVAHQCVADRDCASSDVCAFNGSCTTAAGLFDQLRIEWTIGGQPASASTCANRGDLIVDQPNEWLTYETTIACEAGALVLPHVAPDLSTVAVVLRSASSPCVDASATFDHSNQVLRVDLPQ